MFIKNTSDEEFFKSLEAGLKKTASFNDVWKDKRLSDIVAGLSLAEFNLMRAGLHKEVQMVAVIKEVCEQDDATKGLTSGKMLENLANKGWVFNVDDGDKEEEPEEADDLSPEEIQKLRNLLKSQKKTKESE